MESSQVVVSMNLCQATKHPHNLMKFSRTFLVCDIFRNEERSTQDTKTLIVNFT